MWTLVAKTCEMHEVGLPGVPYPPLTLASCPLTGDCWFLAALGSLTQNPEHLQKILMDQSFDHQYAGIFRFRVRGAAGTRLHGFLCEHTEGLSNIPGVWQREMWKRHLCVSYSA